MVERRVEDNTGSEIKGLKLKSLNIYIFVIEFILFLILFWSSSHVSRGFDQMNNAAENYKTTMRMVYELQDQSDFLTKLVWQYCATGNRWYMDTYCKNLEDQSSRDSQVANFKKEFGSINWDICVTLDEAVNAEEQLTALDIHCMRLIAASQGMSEGLLPDIIAEYELTVQEASYDSDILKKKATEILSGHEYTSAENIKNNGFQEVRQWMNMYTSQNQAEGSAKMRGAVLRQQWLMFALFLATMSMFGLIMFMIINPLQKMVSQIREEKVLDLQGPQEMRYLASTYNDINRINAASKLELNQQANYDALTGILNRGSFNRLCEFLKGSLQPLAFLLIDVDVFKSINDNYGHDVGDEALKKVAGLLKNSFREEDYAIRYGGDEFAVIVTNVNPDEKAAIGEKIDAINRTLKHPEEEFMPAFSLSVGVAFSPKGYNDEVFQKADKAVYYTKEHGRCGYTFFQREMVKVDSKVDEPVKMDDGVETAAAVAE